MEWPDIFKVMKGKDLKPSILYPARLSFRFDGEIKSFTEKKKSYEKSQQSQRTSLGRKHKRRKRPTQNNPKQLRKW